MVHVGPAGGDEARDRMAQHDPLHPVGHARDLAVTTLRLVIEALADGNIALAVAVLEQVQPDSPDNTTATVAGCIGAAPAYPPTGSPAAIRTPPAAWASGSSCQPGTGRRTRRNRHPGPRPQGIRSM